MKPLRALMIAAVASTVLALPAHAEGNGTTGMTSNSPPYTTNARTGDFNTNAGMTGPNTYGTNAFGTRTTNDGMLRNDVGTNRNNTFGTNNVNNRDNRYRANTTRAYAGDDNDGANWLGLLGLLGLAGLFGRNRTRENITER